MSIKYSTSIKKVKYAIRELVPIAKSLEKKGVKIIYLNIGDPLKYDFKTPEHIIEAYYEAARKGHNYYSESQGILELREAIAKFEKRVNGVDIDPDYVVITNGVAEAINFVIRAFINPGDEVLVPSPSYPSYLGAPYLYYGEPIEYRCVEDERWRPDIDDIRRKINEKTRLIVIINPSNPTGIVYNHKVVKEIVDVAAEYNIPIVSDEIYNQILFNGKFYSPAKVSDDAFIIGLNGFSKAYLMTGWRLGYLYIRDPTGKFQDDILDNILRQARLRLCASTPTQYAGIAALEGPQEHIHKMIRKLRERRDYIVRRLTEIENIDTVTPDGTFYVFPKIEFSEWADDRSFVVDLLKNTGVFLVNGSGFGSLCGKGHFRAVFLSPIELIDEAMNRIEKFIKTKVCIID